MLTRFRAVISPTAGGFALGFLLSLSMPGAWRAVAGPVAEETTPDKATGGSLPHRPLATWMLMGLAVYARGLVEWIRMHRLQVDDSAYVLHTARGAVSGPGRAAGGGWADRNVRAT